MNIPLDFWNMGLFLGFLCIILFLTSKLIPRDYGMVETLIHRLEAAALTVSALFLVTVALGAINAIFN